VDAELPTQLRDPSELEERTQASAETEPMAPERPARLARGSTIGRYVILDVVGEGGMGVVYAAYDPQLDRRIAIKLVRPSRRDGTRGRARLLREAQAIARIRHPHVVAVHDVGAVEEDGHALVFVAMEFVEGVTLTQWLQREQPSRERTLAVFVQAGRGLAAAHRAGIVHRDFKPDNVVVGAGDHAWVVDFGLARGRAAPIDGDSLDASSSGSLGGASALASDLTVAGTVMGTPAFMAPEQHIGGETEAPADQFAFCVALYFALYGERPFPGDSAKALAKATLRGDIRAAPPGSKVPGHLRRVLLRGLRTRAAERYPSMTALLQDLQRDPAVRRRRSLLWGGAVLAIAGLLSGAYVSGSRHELEPCADAGVEVVALWNDERRTQIAGVFAAADVAYASDAWARSAGAIDRWVAGWREQQVEACRATRVRGTFSEEMLDRRSMCLHGRLARLEGLLDVFAAADAGVVERSVHMVYELPELDPCADIEALGAAVPLPDSEDARARVQRADASFQRAQALYAAGRFDEVIERLGPVLAEAESLGYLPLVARLRHLVGSAHEALGHREGDELVRRAFMEALEAGDDQLTVLAATSLAQDVGEHARRASEALQLLDLAEAIIRRAPKAVGRRAEPAVTNARAVIAWRTGRTAEAGVLFQRLLELQLERDPEGPNTASALQNLGLWHADAGRWALADEYLERSRVLAESLYGEQHPQLEAIYLSLGQVSVLSDRHVDGRKWLERALAIQLETFGPEHPMVAKTIHALAIAARNLGDPQESERLHRRALQIRRARLEPDHPEIAESLRNLAITLSSVERHPEALAYAREGLAMVERGLDPGSREIGDAHEALAGMLNDAGRGEEALVHARTAVEIFTPKDGSMNARVIPALLTLGDAERRAGRIADALATHERALELAEAHAAETIAPRARFHLGRTLVTQGKDLVRARSLIDLAKADAGDRPELAADLEALDRELAALEAAVR
jgi:tetratricopeptide (TPR) repeat protein/predicted Ser/Thr protein kinase